ncbi:hypothetical protein M2244_003122 [Rhodoferax antarcticus]|nr:hypothetical protein [Rhodoferax antarcticus]
MKDAALRRWHQAEMKICMSGLIEPTAELAGSWGVGLKQIKIQKMFEIDLASQANSALLEASQPTQKRTTP